MTNLAIVHKEPTVEVTTLAHAAVLISLNVSAWAGRKRDKKTTNEVIQQHGAASKKAASVVKNLLSDDEDLDKLLAYAQETRLYLNKNTLAWDASNRMLPSGMVIEVCGELDAKIYTYGKLVDKLVAAYPVKVSAQAFQMGTLFNRNEYPSADEIKRKFQMRYVVTPVPTSGDFRVDVQKDVGEFLKQQYEKAANERVASLMREPWERAFDVLAHAKGRMEALLAYTPEEGSTRRDAPKLFQSVIDNALEQANLLDKLNVTGDVQLKDCAARIRRMFTNADIKSLRESKEKQEAVKKQVEEILDKFDFSDFQMDE